MPTTATFMTPDGLALVRRPWPVAQPQGTVVLVHGISEYSGRYAHVAEQLNAWGWRVEGYDQRGHGESPGQPGALNDLDDLLTDLGALVRLVRAEQPDGPLVLLGHSLGGLVVGRYMAGFTERRRPAWLVPVDGAVLCSPALRPRNPPPAWLVNALARWLPRLPLSTRLSFDPDTISRDPAVVRAYLADPLIRLRITPLLAHFIMTAGAFTLDRAPYWTRPTLQVYAGADQIVDPGGSVAFAQRAPSGLVRSQVFEGHAHELFNDLDKEMVFEAVGRWLDEQFNAHAAVAPQLRQGMGAGV